MSLVVIASITRNIRKAVMNGGEGDRPGVASAGGVDEDRDQAVAGIAPVEKRIDSGSASWNDSRGHVVSREEITKVR
jgi:hypothetical protein